MAKSDEQTSLAVSTTTRKKRGVFYGWWIVLAVFPIHLWSSGSFFYGFTAFFNPLIATFGWSYTATSFAVSLRQVESGIAAPAVGFLSDRLGARKIILAGVIWTGLGFILLSFVQSLWSFYVLFVFLSIGFSFCMPVPGYSAVANWFIKKRSTALGVVSAAAGAGGFVVPVIAWLIRQYDWRVALIVLGLAMWIIGIPLSFVIRYRPEPYGYLPDGEEKRPEPARNVALQGKAKTASSAEAEFTVRQALKTRSLWLLALVVGISFASVQAVAVHIMPFLDTVGVPRAAASMVVALMAVSSAVGRLIFGWLGDRWDKKYLLALTFLLQTVGLLIFAYTHSAWQAIVAMALFGPGMGAVVTFRLAIQADYFGRKAFGSIQGLILGLTTMQTIATPVFAGWIYDMRGSYQLAWLILSMLLFVSMMLTLTLKPPIHKAIPQV